MATTKIKAITSAPDKVLDYVMKNKNGEVAEYEIDGIAPSIAYATNDKDGTMTYHTYTTRLRCTQGKEKETFYKYIAQGKDRKRRGSLRKDGKENVCFHCMQSFSGHECSPETANEIGRKLAMEVFGERPVVISTHTNRRNVHNHIVFPAWDAEGYKWADKDETKRLIRHVSDRLCKEYGLSVLEDTKDMKMTRYTDKDGVQRSVEVTPRKIKKWESCKAGNASYADASDYRQSDAYDKGLLESSRVRERVKGDIDNLLPYVSSYSELLKRLRDLGYGIKDKTKNGGWREHVTFVLPGHKGVRDKSIGENYRREKLTAFIESNKCKIKQPADMPIPDDIKVINIPYSADRTNPDDLHQDYRAQIGQDGAKRITVRSDPERKIIGLIKTSSAEIRKKFTREDYRAMLKAQIRTGFESLNTIEEKGLHSYGQINGLYKAALISIGEAKKDITRLEHEIAQQRALLDLPARIERLREVVDNDLEMGEHGDREKLQSYIRLAAKHKLDTPYGQEAVKGKISDGEERLSYMRAKLKKSQDEASKYEQCIRNLDRIDRRRGERDDEQMKEFYMERKRYSKAQDLEATNKRGASR